MSRAHAARRAALVALPIALAAGGGAAMLAGARSAAPAGSPPPPPAALLAPVPPPRAERPARMAAESLLVDTSRSILRWRGTKGRGLGGHEGTVRLAGGALALCGTDVCGGEFRIDMRSIAVTDIPPHEHEARAQLASHLMAEDFFWVERHPEAVFRLQGVHPAPAGGYAVTGDLHLRGVAHRITFPATLLARTGGEARVGARFSIDRRQWGVSSPGRLRDLLVDDAIQLDLTLVVGRAAASTHR